MNQNSLTKLIFLFRFCIALFVLVLFSALIFSFKTITVTEGLFNQLGISQPNADAKIANSFIGGYLDAYGARNAKNIALANRTAVTKDLLEYTRQFVNTEAFKKQYAQLKERNKPTLNKIQTPEEMRKGLIESYQKAVTDMEATVKKADPSMKKLFEDMLVEAKKNLKEAQDPNNEMIKNYESNYAETVKFNQQAYDQQLKDWETRYPSNQLLFIKKRLQEFLTETKDIDYAAELTEKNGKKYFVNRAYENKSSRWKMAFRAGKEVVEPARAFVQQWIAEIK